MNESSCEPIRKPTKRMDLDAELLNNLSPWKTQVAYSEPKKDAELPSKITDLIITQPCGLCHGKKIRAGIFSGAANCCNRQFPKIPCQWLLTHQQVLVGYVMVNNQSWNL
jgi:hypothetical protein